MLLSSKTIPVPFGKSVHLFPSLEGEGPSYFSGDLIEPTSCLFRSFFCQVRVLGGDFLLQVIIGARWVTFLFLEIFLLEGFKRGDGFSPASDDHSLPLFRLTDQRGSLIFQVSHSSKFGHGILLNVATKIATLENPVNETIWPAGLALEFFFLAA